jgi:PadR family transcriptional regulator PadR
MDVENWKVQLRKGVLEMVILNILKSGHLYGLEMIQKLESIPGLTITEGTIYPLLSRLHADGMVFTEWVESKEGRPRKYYSLSAKGNRVLAELNKAWQFFTENIGKIINKEAV